MPRVPFTTVFVDILGFAALVEQNEWSLDLLDSFYASGKSMDDIRSELTPGRNQPAKDPLDAVFSAFHRTLEVNIDRSLKASHLNAIVFSDSAFVAFEHPEVAFDFAQNVMRDSLSVEVPVRIGIGSGSFRALRFKTDTADKIGLHASYFLGTSVTRAHGAESCGVPGMRILLHPSLAIPLDYPQQVIDVPAYTAKNKTAVTQELCYLHPYVSTWPREDVNSENTNHAKNRRMRIAVEKMRDRSPADKHFQYEETLTAFWTMREKQGLPIIIDWRDIKEPKAAP